MYERANEVGSPFLYNDAYFELAQDRRFEIFTSDEPENKNQYQES